MSDPSKKRRLEETSANSDTHSQVNQLTSLLPTTAGGLQLPRKSVDKGASKPGGNESKSQGTSLLGLDVLADRKRREQPNQDKALAKASFRKINRKQGSFRRRESEEPIASRRNNDRSGDTGSGGGSRRRDYGQNEGGYDNRRNREKNDGRHGGRDSNSKYSFDRRSNDQRQRQDSRPSSSHGGLSRGSGRQNRPQDQRQQVNRSPPSHLSREHEERDQVKGISDTAAVNAPYDSDGEDFDRQFYLADEGGYVVDASDMNSSGQLGRFLFVNEKTKAREQEMEAKRKNPISARQNAMLDDQEAWEENRLLSSGAASRGHVALDVSTEDDTRVTLLVHQLKPPFLEKSSVGLGKQSTVATVKDNSSDFCKMAREGSATLLRLRQEKDKNTMRQKFWELGGSKMGNAMGIKQEEPKADPDDQLATPQEVESGEVDYKKSTGYASHMNKQKKEAVSNFAKTKSITQQREFLPIFSVRDEFLNVVRENNIVVR